MPSAMVLMCHRVPPPAIEGTIPITSEASIQIELLREDAALRVQVLGVSCWGWVRVRQFPCLQKVCSGTGPVLPKKCRKRSADCAVSEKVRKRSTGSFSRLCSLKSQLYWRRIRWSVLIGLGNGKGWKPVTSGNIKKAPASPAYLQQRTDAVPSQQMRVWELCLRAS